MEEIVNFRCSPTIAVYDQGKFISLNGKSQSHAQQSEVLTGSDTSFSLNCGISINCVMIRNKDFYIMFLDFDRHCSKSWVSCQCLFQSLPESWRNSVIFRWKCWKNVLRNCSIQTCAALKLYHWKFDWIENLQQILRCWMQSFAEKRKFWISFEH